MGIIYSTNAVAAFHYEFTLILSKTTREDMNHLNLAVLLSWPGSIAEFKLIAGHYPFSLR